MTSKEAFENIMRDYYILVIALYYSSDMPKNERDKLYSKYDKELELIEEDLEILEILKKHLTTMPRIGLGTEKYEDIILIPNEDEEDNKRVREWLEK